MADWEEPMQSSAEEAEAFLESLDIDSDEIMTFARMRFESFRESMLKEDYHWMDEARWVTFYTAGFIEGAQFQKGQGEEA